MEALAGRAGEAGYLLELPLMASPLTSVLRYVERLVGLPMAAAYSDGQLLDRYVTGRDESALATLMQRHGPLVWSVCLRLLPDVHDAEDAFQATFIVLTRKAASLERRPSLAAWLYEVAQRTALQARALASKRRRREQQAAPRPASTDSDQVDREELKAVLDAELSSLPERYRAPVVLCDLQGKSHLEAATELNMPSGSLSKRLARGRELLRERLARRGVTASAALLPALLAEQAARADVPLPLLNATQDLCRTSTIPAGVQAGLIAEGVLRTMYFSKLKIAAALLLAASVTVAAGLAMQGKPASSAVAFVPAPEKQAELPPSSEPVELNGLTLTVVAAKAAFALGEPLEFTAEYKNTSNRELVLPKEGLEQPFHYSIIGVKDRTDGDRLFPGKNWVNQPFKHAQAKDIVKIQPGESYKVKPRFGLGDLRWNVFAKPQAFPDAGLYMFKVEVRVHDAWKKILERQDLWLGSMLSKPVFFTVEDMGERNQRLPAVKDGLAVSVTPLKSVFAKDEPPKFRIDFKNVSDHAFAVYPADVYQLWEYTFVNKEGKKFVATDRPHFLAPPLQGLSEGPHILQPGKSLLTIASISPEDFEFDGKDESDYLPPGEYRLTILIKLEQSDEEKIMSWKGDIETKPVTLTIGDQLAPGPKASLPAIKDGLSVTATPTRTVFAKNESPTFRVEFKNETERAFFLYPADLHQGWEYTLFEEGKQWRASGAWRKPPVSHGPVVLEPGKTLETVAVLGPTPGVTFQFSNQLNQTVEQLPAGNYLAAIRIKLESEPEKRKFPHPFWVGTILTQRFQFTIADKEAPIDANLAEKAVLIVRAKRTRTVSTPLQPADDIEVLEVLRDATTKGKAGATIRVFRGEFSPAIPDRPCTVYLTERGKDWALVGVSHADK